MSEIMDLSPRQTIAQAGHMRNSGQPILGVKRQYWRMDDETSQEADIEFKEVRKEALRRDNYTCVFCGFRAGSYQEIHHYDDDHHNNDIENLLTTCTLCHQVHHLGLATLKNRGFFAALPEFTQTEINHFARFCILSNFATKLSAGADLPVVKNQNQFRHNVQFLTELNKKFQSLYAILENRGARTLSEIFGMNISTGLAFAEAISNLSDEAFADRANRLAPIRFVANKNSFSEPQMIRYLDELGNLNLSNWQILYEQMNKGA